MAVATGEPGNFPPPEALRAKFAGLVAPYLSPRRIDALAGAIGRLETAADIGALLRLTQPDRATSAAAS